MTSEINFMISGIVFGLSGGLIPGPLLTLVVSESLKHGIKEGIKISISPLITDLPIVLLTILILSQLSDIHPILGTISMFGGAFLIYLGYESLAFKGIDINTENIRPQSIRKGVITNFLNPSPYMFWFTVGAPTIVKAVEISATSAFLFIFCFYVCLVGSKVIVALIAGRSRLLLKSNSYIYAIRSLGIILLIFALLFIRNGLMYFGVI